jgi:hypothetical protein
MIHRTAFRVSLYQSEEPFEPVTHPSAGFQVVD